MIKLIFLKAFTQNKIELAYLCMVIRDIYSVNAFLAKSNNLTLINTFKGIY